MRPRMTETLSSSVGFSHRFISRRGVIYAVVSVWFGLMSNGPILEAATLPTVDEVLEELHIPAIDRKASGRARSSDWSASEGSERELAPAWPLPGEGQTGKLRGDVSRGHCAERGIGGHGTWPDHGRRHHGGLGRGEVTTERRKRSQAVSPNVEPGDELNLDAKRNGRFSSAEGRRRSDSVRCTQGRGPCAPGAPRPLPCLSDRGAVSHNAPTSVVTEASGMRAMNYPCLPRN